MAIEALKITVKGRSLKRQGYDSFYRAGKKWPDSVEGATVELFVILRATESSVSDAQAKEIAAAYQQGLAISEASFAALMAEPQLAVSTIGTSKRVQVTPKAEAVEPKFVNYIPPVDGESPTDKRK